MKTKNFSFELPEHLIAQYPAENRGESRLMVADPESGKLVHAGIHELPRFAEPGTVIVFNNSKVIPGRIFGMSETGGNVEFLLLKRTGPGEWSALVSKKKRQKPGKSYTFPGEVTGTITGETEREKTVSFTPSIDIDYLERYGSVPLPPYIKRRPNRDDAHRYQTIYADEYGSAAAPTAGLHFTGTLLERLRKKGIYTAEVTLHVGIGTFLPIRSEDVENHTMHREWYRITPAAADLINTVKRKNGKLLAVGTTTVRTLESACRDGEIVSGEDCTDIFIYPGYRFQAVDQLLTNFHTPQSSLLVMISAFAGADFIRKAYEEAVRQEYRFFSYGDAMLITGRG